MPHNGDDEDGCYARFVVAGVEWLGHTRMIFKSENESAVLALRRRVARLLKMGEHMENVQEENSAAYDSQSNGGVEIGVCIARCIFRTLKLRLARPEFGGVVGMETCADSQAQPAAMEFVDAEVFQPRLSRQRQRQRRVQGRGSQGSIGYLGVLLDSIRTRRK